MNLPGLRLDWTPNGPVRVAERVVLPVEALLLGRRLAEAAALLPRLFNLCSEAQGVGFRLATGMAQGTEAGPGSGMASAADDLRAGIMREHLARLCVIWPRALGLPVMPPALPEDFALPAPGAFGDWLRSDAAFAPVMARIAGRFRGALRLPDPGDDRIAAGLACENTPAGRRAAHPLMQAVEAGHGRGMLWRALGRLVDLVATAGGDLPAPRLIAPGAALVAAARGAYLLRAAHSGDRLTALSRVTPTDALLAPGGLIPAALAGLPDRDSMELALAILDPCLPVELHEALHA